MSNGSDDIDIDLNAFAAEFENLRTERHNKGAEEYGPTKFMEEGTDLSLMIYEELADAANYLAYMYIRLRTMEELIKHESSNNSPDEDVVDFVPAADDPDGFSPSSPRE